MGRAGLGFFGEVRIGTVENFTIYGEVRLNGKYDFVGGVIGSAPGVGSNKPARNGATIRNVTSYVDVILGAGSHGSNRVGGFVGYANHETLIENCTWYGTLDLGQYRAQDGVGGLVGKANNNSAVTIRNCAAYGTIKTSYQSGSYSSHDTIYIGGIVSNSVSSAKTVIENTLWAGTIVDNTNLGEKAHISAFGTLNGIGSIINCYALNNAPYITTNGTHDSYITAVTASQIESGETAYMLGSAWGQDIGSDDRPVLGGKKVYYGYTTCADDAQQVYTNDEEVSDTKPEHSYADGKCVNCGAIISYTITATANPAEGGSVTGGAYEQGASVTLTAVPSEGYAFISWTENGSTVSTSAEYTFTASVDRSLTANFAAGVKAVLRLPAELKAIEAEAFAGGTFDCVILPEGCERIGAAAFANCAKLQLVEIPASVLSIDDTAFDGCSDSLVIATAAGSEAASYAEKHGIRCVVR